MTRAGFNVSFGLDTGRSTALVLDVLKHEGQEEKAYGAKTRTKVEAVNCALIPVFAQPYFGTRDAAAGWNTNSHWPRRGHYEIISKTRID